MSRRVLLAFALAGCLGVAACGGSKAQSGSTVTTPDGAATTGAATAANGSGTTTATAAPYGGDRATSTGSTSGGPSRPAAGSRTQQVLTLQSGVDLTYTLVLPTSYRPGGTTYPVLLALPPGSQGQDEVDALLDKWWAPEATERGWIVVSPVAPDGQLFFSGSSATLVELMDSVAATYPPEGGKFHLAGVSNGGLSAYRIALDAPERFASLLVAPGFPPDDADRANLRRLVKIPVASYVGEQDSSWREASVRTVRELNRLGGRATLTVSPGEGHILQKITARQLFDVLEKTRPNH